MSIHSREQPARLKNDILSRLARHTDQTSSCPNILGVRALGDDSQARLGPFGDRECGEGKRLANLVGTALDLQPVTLLGSGEVVDVNIRADAGRVVSARGNGQTTSPVCHGGREGPVQSAFGVELAGCHLESSPNQPRLSLVDDDLAQEEFIDGTVGTDALPHLLNLLEFCAHGEGGIRDEPGRLERKQEKKT